MDFHLLTLILQKSCPTRLAFITETRESVPSPTSQCPSVFCVNPNGSLVLQDAGELSASARDLSACD